MPRRTSRSDGEVRKITHPVRFAESEYEQIKENSSKGRVSVSEYIRRAALRRKIAEDPPPPQINRELYEQFGQINSNLSQLVKAIKEATKQGQIINIDPLELEKIIADISPLIKETQRQLLLYNSDKK